jgi:hypothetical protein
MIESAFASHDGVELFYRAWPARSGTAKGAIVILHRGHEHSGRVAHLADELALDGFASTPGTPAATAARRARAATRRALPRWCAISTASSRHIGDRPTASRWRTRRSSPRASARCWRRRGCTTMRRRSARWCWRRRPSGCGSTCPSPAPASGCCAEAARHFFVKSYVKARMLTHDPSRAASFDADPLITRAIAVDILLG